MNLKRILELAQLKAYGQARMLAVLGPAPPVLVGHRGVVGEDQLESPLPVAGGGDLEVDVGGDVAFGIRLWWVVGGWFARALRWIAATLLAIQFALAGLLALGGE